MIEAFCRALANRLRNEHGLDARTTGNEEKGHWVHVVMRAADLERRKEILEKLRSANDATVSEFSRKIENHRLALSQALVGAKFEYLNPSPHELPSVGMGYVFADFRPGAKKPTLLFKPISRPVSGK